MIEVNNSDDEKIIYCIYFSRRALLILDLNHMMDILIEEFGLSFCIKFNEMTQEQKIQNSHSVEILSVPIIDNLVNIYTEKNNLIKRDVLLEDKILKRA